jgi:betaine reductase
LGTPDLLGGAFELKIVHYINQFFAGIGGEDSADAGPELKEEPLGPGRKLNSLLGDDHQIVATVCCGDDYAASNENAAEEIVALVEGTGAEMLVAGPAFTSGRNGIACGRVAAAASAAGLKALAAMHPDNPGVAEAAPAPVVPTGETAREMKETLEAMADAIAKLAAGEPIPDAIKGKEPRKNRMTEDNAATRAVALVLKRLGGDESATEIPLPDFGTVEPAAAIEDPAEALIALLTEGGLVPDGNPGRLESARATRWLRYPLEGRKSMPSGEFQSIHGGFSTAAANADPNRILPLDVAREMEEEGLIGQLHSEYLVTVGNGMPVDSATDYGVEWAEELRKAGVQAAILTST